MRFLSKIAALAARRVDDAACADCPAGPPGADPAFSTAVTALGAKLAKADGRPDLLEFDAFARIFPASDASERNIQRLYELASQTTRGFESYAKRLAKRYRQCPELLEDVLDGLFHIAGSDGAVTAAELDYLEQVSGHLGLSMLTFRRLKATHLGLDAEDPYNVLAIPHDASDGDVRLAWRRLLSEAHPDRATARGLPAEFVELAEAKSARINAAFDSIMRERRLMAPA
jgi:DnaJ like chaperone protein